MKKLHQFCLIVICLWPGIPAAPALSQTEEIYEKFRTVYANDESSDAELRALLPGLKAAFERSPKSYKLAFGIAAALESLGELQAAETWYKRAGENAATDADRDIVAGALTEIRIALRKRQVAEAPGVLTERIAFALKLQNYKDGNFADAATLPSALPTVKLNADPAPLIAELKRAAPGAEVEKHDDFIIVNFSRRKSAAKHYDGFKDFYFHFRRALYRKPPTSPIVAVLGDDARPLVDMVRRLYDDTGVTDELPFFGLYNPADNIMFATITGGYGTLLHELGHALIQANYPDAPFWLEEGAAMLYERSVWRDGKPEPLENWRMGLRPERTLRDADILSMIGRNGQRRLTAAQTNDVRMLALHLYRTGALRDMLANAAAKPDMTPGDILDLAKISPADWEGFIATAYADYRSDLNALTPSYKSEKVLLIQKALNATIAAGLSVDGQWGGNTRNAIQDFQRKFGLTADGIPGTRTMNALKRRYKLTALE